MGFGSRWLSECRIEVVIGEEKKVVSCGLVGWLMYSSRVIAVEFWFVRLWKAGERTGDYQRVLIYSLARDAWPYYCLLGLLSVV